MKDAYGVEIKVGDRCHIERGGFSGLSGVVGEVRPEPGHNETSNPIGVDAPYNYGTITRYFYDPKDIRILGSAAVQKALEERLGAVEVAVKELLERLEPQKKLKVCQGTSCSKEGSPELHTCPYLVDICDNEEDLCNCCEGCQRECYMDT